jgi:hypothetical protein
VTGLVASNGVPIPDPPLKDPCAALGVAVASCGALDTCPPLTCDCGGVPKEIEVSGSCGFSRHCLTAVSCAAVCAIPDLGASALPGCVYPGVCKGDVDCTDPGTPSCLLAPADTSGICVSRKGGSACYRDSDCVSSVCVAIPGGNRFCQDAGVKGSICNRDDQCPVVTAGVGKSACIIPDGEFYGPCTDGTNGAPCLAGDDCVPGDTCAQLVPGGFGGQCTSGAQGAPCAVDADCDQGVCIGQPSTWGTCQTGEVGSTCRSASDCHTGFCVASKCTTGTNGSTCISDTDCAMHVCASLGAAMPGQCTDGQQGSPCWGVDGKQCQAGLICQGMTFPGACLVPGIVGAPCQSDGDCMAGKCGGVPQGPPGLALCTEGKRGQRCRDTSQCDPGLQCISNGLSGVCVAGAPGDPCHTPADCMHGMCMDRPGTRPSMCNAGTADLTPCGMLGMCVAESCLPVCF